MLMDDDDDGPIQKRGMTMMTTMMTMDTTIKLVGRNDRGYTTDTTYHNNNYDDE